MTAVCFLLRLFFSFCPCSDPDIKIGLSILAYRYEGLRRSDFESVLRDLHEEMSQELIPFNRRQACIRFAQWVALAGGRVRGWNRVEEEERQRKKEKREQAERLLREAEQELAAAALAPKAPRPAAIPAASTPSASDIFFPSPSNGGDLDLLSSPNYSGTSSSGTGSSASVVGSMTPTRSSALAAGVSPGGPAGEIDGGNREEEVWPLQLIDIGDEEQMDVLYNLLHKLPHLSYHYLMGSIFPPVMRHQRLKLSASGQSLGGDMLFKKRLAFSGTPSDLLPLELGKCQYEKGSDGKMLHYLSSPEIMSQEELEPDWSVKSLLDRVARASPPAHALIDTGALVTGMSNYEVARYLLRRGLSTMAGVVFLDAADKKMILLRTSMKVVPLDQSGIDRKDRFRSEQARVGFLSFCLLFFFALPLEKSSLTHVARVSTCV